MSRGAKVQLTIDANSKQAEDGLRRVQAEAARTGESVSKLDQAAAAQHLERFDRRLQKNAEAARYFGGETSALEKEQQMLRREIERLIRQGMDPLDSTVRNLRTRYDENAASLTRLTSSKQTYTAATRTATRTAATFLRTILPIASAAAAIGTATRFIRESGQAFEEAEAQAQKFAITYDGITDEAERRARELASTFGYAQSSMRGILAETGDILTGFGLAGEAALDLTERATYLGAALAQMNPNIGDAADATGDLTKLMAGQAMSMQKWGVVVRDSAVQARLAEQGLSGLTGEALLQAQAQARLEIAYEQSRNALENVTSDTVLAADVNRRYNEAWKERREIVGEAVNNFFVPIRSRITEHIEAWNEATRAAQNYHGVLTEGIGDVPAAVREAEKQLESAKAWYDFLDQPGRRTGSIWGPDSLDHADKMIQQAQDRLDFVLHQQREAEQAAAAIPHPYRGLSESSQEAQANIRQYFAAASSTIEAELEEIAQKARAMDLAGIAFDVDAAQAEAVQRHFADVARGALELADQEVKEAAAGLNLGEFFDRRYEIVGSAIVSRNTGEKLFHAGAYVQDFWSEFADAFAAYQPQDIDIAGSAFSGLSETLQQQLTSIDQLAAAYAQAGGEFDEFSQKQRAVISTFEQLARSGADQEYLQNYIDKYAGFFAVVDEGEPSLRTLQEILSSVDEAAFNAAQAAWRMGEESEIASSRIAVMEDELQQMIDSGKYSEWQIYQMETAIRSLKDELEDTSAFRVFEQAMAEAFGGMLQDFTSSLGQGGFDAVRSTEQGMSSIFSAVSTAAMTAMPQFAPLIAMAEGAVQGLNKAIFDTIAASREAQRTIADQREEIGGLFAEVLGLEQELHRQRIDAIREQMDLLSDQHNLEMEILRDRWQRGEITGEQYFSQAMQASSAYREEQASYERQSSLIEGVRDTIGTLQDELSGLSGWSKFWTSADTKLEQEISRYEALLAALSTRDGLTEAEIQQLAQDHGVTVPGAARGADFITSGPMLMAVGENPGGREHVQITPMSSYNAYGPSKAAGAEIHIHITGDVYGVDDLYARLDAAGKRLKKLGRLPA